MTSERWRQFSKHDQMLFIASEFERANVWQNKDNEKFRGALERALTLIDLTLDDEKWKNDLSSLLGLRDETAKFYIGERSDAVGVLSEAL